MWINAVRTSWRPTEDRSGWTCLPAVLRSRHRLEGFPALSGRQVVPIDHYPAPIRLEDGIASGPLERSELQGGFRSSVEQA